MSDAAAQPGDADTRGIINALQLRAMQDARFSAAVNTLRTLVMTAIDHGRISDSDLLRCAAVLETQLGGGS